MPSKALSARSLEVLILTAGRTSEVLKAQWGEIDLDERLWVVPAERMKGKRVHRVPLSEQVLKIAALGSIISNIHTCPSQRTRTFLDVFCPGRRLL
jgi:integrase